MPAVKQSFLFSEQTVDRLDKLKKHFECSRGKMIERLIRAAAEALEQKEAVKVQDYVDLDAMK